MTSGTLYIVSAPSGCGKTSLVSAILKSVDHICVSISHTTRLPRPNEKESQHYYFVTHFAFTSLIKEKAFLEYATVFDHYYGTSIKWVKSNLEKGLDVIVEIDWQGALQIKQKLPDAVGIFILPPSWESLKERLTARGQDSQVIIDKRMQQAKIEMSHYNEYDYIIINSDFEKAFKDFQSIIYSYRLRQQVQSKKLAQWITRLI